MLTLDEKIELILEGKDPKELQVVPATVTGDIENPATVDIAPEAGEDESQVQDPKNAEPEAQEEPPVSIDNPLSVAPLVTPDGTEQEATDKKVEESTLVEMAMDTLSHPVHGKLSWDNEDGVHKIKKEGKTVFSGSHEEVATRWKAIKQSLQEGVTLDESVDSDYASIMEALRLVSTHGEGQNTAKVYKDPEWEEHRVKFFKDGKHQNDADYHTDDVEDAKSTAEAELKRMNTASQVESAEELLASDARLTEEFKIKAKELFEEKLAERVKEVEDRLVAKLAIVLEQVAAEKEEYINTLSEKIDVYLDQVSEQWAVENKAILESNARLEIAESFVTNVKGIFESLGMEIPEAKKDTFAEMEESVAEMQGNIDQLNMQLKESIDAVNELTREKIINENVKGLTNLDQARMMALVEDVEYTDAESFSKRISSIKSSAFPAKGVLVEDKLQMSNTPIISEDSQITSLTPKMQAYLKALQG